MLAEECIPAHGLLWHPLAGVMAVLLISTGVMPTMQRRRRSGAIREDEADCIQERGKPAFLTLS